MESAKESLIPFIKKMVEIANWKKEDANEALKELMVHLNGRMEKSEIEKALKNILV